MNGTWDNGRRLWIIPFAVYLSFENMPAAPDMLSRVLLPNEDRRTAMPGIPMQEDERSVVGTALRRTGIFEDVEAALLRLGHVNVGCGFATGW